MGNESDNVNQANTEKATYDKTLSNMKIGVCEMQGWRRTMEDAAIVLPNFEKNTSLFGILDGHGGSIISEFVSVNFKNILIRLNSYKNGQIEKALIETFLIMDELLKNKKINNFIYTTHNSKDKQKENIKPLSNPNNNDNIVKLRFETGVYEFDLNQIDLSIGGEDTSTTIYEYKQELTTPLSNIENNNIKIEDIFFEKGGKQNASLNTLPTFEETFNIKKLEVDFNDIEDDDKEKKLFIENMDSKKLQLTKNISSNSSTSKSSYENLVASEMGTTANILLIKNGVIYIANVGDSLSVMYKHKKAYNLNKEHQTIIESEKERVLKSGANIVGYRINGMLNLTRAIGDLRFKANSNLKRHEQSVISLPEITKIEDTEGIDFIILGCDGVWDCVKRQLVCDFVDSQIKAHPKKNLSEILKVIFDRCVSPVWGVVLGTDNMSCIIIQFLHNEKNKEENDIVIKKVNINEGVIENIDKENVMKN
jgi:serine/threonine protein phosphatase PrpC